MNYDDIEIVNYTESFDGSYNNKACWLFTIDFRFSGKQYSAVLYGVPNKKGGLYITKPKFFEKNEYVKVEFEDSSSLQLLACHRHHDLNPYDYNFDEFE